MKINWAHLFSDRVLERGWAYYCDDKILDVSRNGDTYDAYVIGSDFYPGGDNRERFEDKQNEVRVSLCGGRAPVQAYGGGTL